MSLRLTLRTLLAYLDDTLPPAEARDIGQRLGENEAIQKLVDRIRTVTRRRRLMAYDPEPEHATIEPNDIAEYLDNVLDADRVTELERLCLESDTTLAEVACVHQILSMVLGAPAEVSP